MGLGCKCGIHPGPTSISKSEPRETGHSLRPEALVPGEVSKGAQIHTSAAGDQQPQVAEAL